ncbi:MAG: hypothetical protein Unbinned400contig1000_39 [Prokaryotic dsDNA virus sp.]|nr:MAG: hypothetical protein Unbinned400contig1000_39 [Prokaryotic dsDNA virus sp.]|tara:strand:- start:6564 stop:7052 length:489 start_codon:yes stop_codon:yes gene_type:complete
MRAKVGQLSLLLFVILCVALLTGCDDDKVKLADGTIVDISDLPPGIDPDNMDVATIEDIIEYHINRNEEVIDLIPYGSAISGVALGIIGMLRKTKPEREALREIFDGIEKTNGSSEAVLNNLSATMSPKSKGVVESLRRERAIADVKKNGGKRNGNGTAHAA